MTKYLVELENDRFERHESSHVDFTPTHIVFRGEYGQPFVIAYRATDIVTITPEEE